MKQKSPAWKQAELFSENYKLLMMLLLIIQYLLFIISYLGITTDSGLWQGGYTISVYFTSTASPRNFGSVCHTYKSSTALNLAKYSRTLVFNEN